MKYLHLTEQTLGTLGRVIGIQKLKKLLFMSLHSTYVIDVLMAIINISD